MEAELEPRVKPLAFKVKASSRESPSQKAVNVVDPDLRTHWSTVTNTKEWIVLELEEPCLFSHIRIYNKSVLEWEITAGLRYKPEAFVKVRPRCESPRREVLYPMNYTPCRYVRIACLRGNPIAIFFIQILSINMSDSRAISFFNSDEKQLIGVSVTGLEPELLPVVNYLLPHIISHKQETHDMHLQLLQDMANRLPSYLPLLETDLASFPDAAESNTRFFAMLVGPFYPILRVAIERETAKALANTTDSDAFRNNQSSLTVSSNFEAQPRRSRSPSLFTQPASSFIVFRPDLVIMLLRKAYKDSHLGIVCQLASRVLQKFVGPVTMFEESPAASDLATSAVSDENAKSEPPVHVHVTDYSSLFGEDFKISDDRWDTANMNILDIAAVEEGILHVLYACASQPHLCCKLADTQSDFWSVLPLVQALLPALRPPISSSPDQSHENLWQWKHPSVQQALSQIVAMASSTAHRSFLHACAGYLSSFIPVHVKSACVLIDLCSGPLSPWISTLTAKVDLAVELLEDLLGVIQGAHHSISRARAALKYVILAISGHVDDILPKYKEFKHNLLFLLEMLEVFLGPAMTATKNTIAFGDVSAIFLEKQEESCAIALNIIHTALLRPSVLPSLEAEWKRGSVTPSVLLSVLGPHMPLPPEIDLCKCSVPKIVDQESSSLTSSFCAMLHGSPAKSSRFDEFDGKNELSEAAMKIDVHEETTHLFAPQELKRTKLTSLPNYFIGNHPDRLNSQSSDGNLEKFSSDQFQNSQIMDTGFFAEYFNLQADYLQLVNYQDCEVRASEFLQLATDLGSQEDINPEGHDAVVDALLLAAECYINPFFMLPFRPTSKLLNRMKTVASKMHGNDYMVGLGKDFQKDNNSSNKIAHIESKRDNIVLRILVQAAKLDKEYVRSRSQEEVDAYGYEDNEKSIDISQHDVHSVDAVTFARQNQHLLCHFVIQQLKRGQHASHEVLLQSLIFLLCSATELSCPPENVVDIILQLAENLNVLLTSIYNQLKEGKIQFDSEKCHSVRRRWLLLQRLVIASSGTVEGTDFISHTRNGFQYRCLVPPSSWMQKISKFSNCPFPLVRFLGWMAISRYAQQYLKDHLFLSSEFLQLTSLLSIFLDDLSFASIIKDQKVDTSTKDHSDMKETRAADQSAGQDSFPILYPDIHKFFPSIKKQFLIFGENILEAVGLQLKRLPCSTVPDVLCWFSDLCLSPYPESDSFSFASSADRVKGNVATNVKAILLYLLESIVTAHMEVLLPEMPRVAHILVSLCRASYCDVALLDSVLCLLRPLISYFLRKVAHDEKLLTDVVSELDCELVSFEELFAFLRCRKENQEGDSESKGTQGSLMIFILGSVFPDFSFRRKIEILQCLLLWVDFAMSEPTSSFYNYLHAFQRVMDSCYVLLAESMESIGVHISSEIYQLSEPNAILNLDSSSPGSFVVQNNLGSSSLTKSDKEEISNLAAAGQGVHHLSSDEINEFAQVLELVIYKLLPSTEVCWNLHCKLAMKLTFTLAKCFMFSTCLSSANLKAKGDNDSEVQGIGPLEFSDHLSKHWSVALQGLTRIIETIQQDRCWQVASAMLDYLLGLPQTISLDCVIHTLCSAIKHFCCHAPRISWRLQSDRWLSSLFKRGIGSIDGYEDSVVDLFLAMLGHSEPEQRAVALQHLGRIVGLGENVGITRLSYLFCQILVGSEFDISVPETLITALVSTTWDVVATLALSDTSSLLRRHALALLTGYIPFAKRNQLQSFLSASNIVLQGFGRLSNTMEEFHWTSLSLVLLATACLYSPTEDIALIPEIVWKNLESMGSSRNGAGDLMEKNLCVALCKIRNEPVVAKQVLDEVSSLSSTSKYYDPNFRSVRESILQVLSSLSSVQSYFDFFSEKLDQEFQELEEAEIEKDLLQKEVALKKVSASSHKELPLYLNLSSDLTDNTNRLQKIKDEIRSLEKSKIREEIIARRQKKLLMCHARQKYLEEVTSQQMELLQDLDREKASEVEREIERQRILELERAKTRELQHTLDMERERQTQKELQWELEQIESGARPSQRDFSSNTARPRERYRERESGRSGQEASLRSSSRGGEGGSMQQAGSGPSIASPVQTVMLAGSRSFSGQLPTILQARERQEERNTGYEDNLDGSRDSGDTNSAGDSELASAFDGMGGSFGAATRHGSRGGRSRHVADRRERDGRREGKWERKH